MTRINREMVPKFFAFAFAFETWFMHYILQGMTMHMAHYNTAQLCCPAACLGTGKAGQIGDLHWHGIHASEDA